MACELWAKQYKVGQTGSYLHTLVEIFDITNATTVFLFTIDAVNLIKIHNICF